MQDMHHVRPLAGSRTHYGWSHLTSCKHRFLPAPGSTELPAVATNFHLRWHRDFVGSFPSSGNRCKRNAGSRQNLSDVTSQRLRLETVVLFILPTMSTVLADPLMGLVDVLCLGQGASTLDIAALGPNLTVFNFISYAFFFLATITMIKTSELVGKKDIKAAETTLFGAFLVALLSGTLIGGALMLWPKAILGSTGALPVLLEPAAAYAQVRALSLPASLATMVLQSGLLAQKNTRIPSRAIACAVLCNVAGDYTLVNICGMGLLGSAVATSVGNYVGFLSLVRYGYGKGRDLRLRANMPSRAFWHDFAKSSMELSIFSIANQVCFLSVQAAATQLTVMSCAAFQAVFSLWSFACMSSFPLQQAVQVFLAAELSAHGPGRHSQHIIRVLVRLAVILGIILAVCVGGVTAFTPSLLARDPLLWPCMRACAPLVALSLLIAGPTQVLDGVLQTTNGAGFLAKCTLAYCVFVYGSLSIVINTQANSVWIWAVLFLNFMTRTLVNSTRIALLRGTRAI